MTISHKKCLVMAEQIVKLYRSGSLKNEQVDRDQLVVFITKSGRRLQVKQNEVHVEVVSEIVNKIKVFKHINFADPILVIEDDEGYFLINGNHTAHALEQVIRNGKIVPGLKTAPIAIIPEDLLPSEAAERLEVLKLVGTIMNRVEKIVRGMTKGDIKHLIMNDMIDGKDIYHDDYQEVMAEAAQMEKATIRELVSKVKLESLVSMQNKKFHFKQYTVAELNGHKVDRETNETEVTWAVVTTDKIYETLGKAIGNMIERSCTKAHIIFHFKNYEDVKKLQSKTQERISKFMQTSSVNLTYEFLEWKAEDAA